MVLVTDGLWRSVSEEELVENLLSAMNVQRSSSQLVRLAFSRDSTDNATMTAWQYVVGGADEVRQEPRAASREKSRARAAEWTLVAVLVLVLAGIFAVGFSFGWRITDTFRKPAKQKAKQAQAKKETAPSSQPNSTTPQTTGPQGSSPQTTQPIAPAPVTATVVGTGVRMRSTSDPNGAIVGTLKSGEKVVVIGDIIGTDGKAWAKVRGTVTASGRDIQGEGFVRNDLLNR